MKMAGDCDAFEDEFAYIFELTDNRSGKQSLLRGFLPIILAFPNLMPSVEAVRFVVAAAWEHMRVQIDAFDRFSNLFVYLVVFSNLVINFLS